jgi:hypothetical protein
MGLLPPSANPNRTHVRPAPIEVLYTNHRGETRTRLIVPMGLRWGVTQWHPEPGWLLDAWDIEKDARRSFSLADCDFSLGNNFDARG